MPSPSQCVNVTSGLSIEFPPRAFHFVTGGAMRPAVSVTHFQLFEKIPQSTHVKISQVVPGLLPEQCLNNIIIMREQHCWTNNIVHGCWKQGIFVLIKQGCSLYNC